MALKQELQQNVETVFKSNWTSREGRVVPEPSDVKLSNDAVILERATVLYADLSGSTTMVDKMSWQRSAEIYKTFLYCCGKIIRSEGGVITSYDGDRVMGVFIAGSQSTSAVRAALKINWAVQFIVDPAFQKQYPGSGVTVSHVVGIDTSKIRVARTGVRGDNDLVWVGRAANYAAKLTEIKLAERTWITKAVYDVIEDKAKFGGSQMQDMWKAYSWSQHDNLSVYGSTWRWSID